MTTWITGTLRYLDLGPGAWVLEGDDGRRYELVGDLPPGLDGHRVAVRGRPARELLSAAMAGELLEVEELRPT